MIELILLIVLGVLSFLVGWAIGVYNTIKTAKNDIAGSFADLVTEYRRRIDIFWNLSKAVKSHQLFEKETLVELTRARSGLNGSLKNSIDGLKKVDKLVGFLEARLENYPKLKSNKLYVSLMEEIAYTEARVNESRREYNAIVEDYNTYIDLFPVVLLANVFKAKPATYYENETASKDPEPVLAIGDESYVATEVKKDD